MSVSAVERGIIVEPANRLIKASMALQAGIGRLATFGSKLRTGWNSVLLSPTIYPSSSLRPEEYPSEADIKAAKETAPHTENSLMKWALRFALPGTGLFAAACATAPQEVSKPAIVEAAATLAPGVGGSIATYEAGHPNAVLNPIIVKIQRGEYVSPEEMNLVNAAKAQEAKTNATAEAQKSPEAEQQAQCSFFTDSKYCGLAEVYEMNNPRVGNFKGVGIKGPIDPSAKVEVVAPFDGYLRHSPKNPGSGSISTDRNSLNGFSMEGNFEFIPITRADGMPVSKGQKIATIKDLGLTAIPQAPDYIARFLPQNTDEQGSFSYPEQSIAEHFSTAHQLPARELTSPSTQPKSYQREGAIVENKNTN